MSMEMAVWTLLARGVNGIYWWENPGQVAAGSLPVRHSVLQQQGASVSAIHLADVDDDGDVDVLSASGSFRDSKIVWYANDGSGGFAKQRVISTEADDASSVYAADVDRDGDIDVLSASRRDDKIAWYANDGSGGFGEQRVISTAADSASSVYAADVDRDGDIDVLSASGGRDDKIAWYANDGSGGFGEQRVISTAADGASSVYAADVDNDGDIDVLSASRLDDKIAWYANDGIGGFGEQRVISTAADGASSVYAADVDSDGDIDVLSASGGRDDKIAWYANDGSGGFGEQRVISTAADGVSSVYAADVDNDGNADVLSASLDGKIAWNANDGIGGFGEQRVISTAADRAESVYAADVDRDGDLDLLSASFGDDKIAWYANDGSGGFGEQRVISTAANGPHSVYAADVDGDGDVDVLSASFDNIIAWYANDGTGRFSEQRVISTAAEFARSVYAADADGDGDIDVLSASDRDDKIAWYANDGIGGFGEQRVISNEADGASSVHAADVDNDGDIDVLSASRRDDKIAWYANDGSGRFGEQRVISNEADGAESVYAADVDSDGDSDVLSASWGDDKIAWYANDGTGRFSEQRVISTAAEFARSVYAADADGDGDIDVFSASFGDNKIAWYANDGSGGFGEQRLISTGANDAESVYAVDMDGDRDLDVLSASSTGGIAWYRNTLVTADSGQPRALPELAYGGKTLQGRIYVRPGIDEVAQVTHFQLDTITGGTVSAVAGNTPRPLIPGDFLTAEEGRVGLIWTADVPLSDARTVSFRAATGPNANFAGTEAATLDVAAATDQRLYQFDQSVYQTREIPGVGTEIAVTITTSGSGTGTVQLRGEDGTATAFPGLGEDGDFVALPVTIDLAPGERATYRVIILDDDELENDESFSLVLTDPTGDVVLGGTARATVVIRDNEVFGNSGSDLNVIAPRELPASNGRLRVELSGPAAGAQWRLRGESEWRGGLPAIGLGSGNHWVEFRSVQGWTPPEALFVPIIGEEVAVRTRAFAYQEDRQFPPGRGDMRVLIEPKTVAAAESPAARGQWRLSGEETWHDGGVSLNLPAGIHLVEFKSGVAGFTQPGSREVIVWPGQTQEVTGVYLFRPLATGTLPSVLPLRQAAGAAEDTPAVSELPYAFAGQIATFRGFGSGYAVRPRSVLTAQHVIFDDTTLSYVPEVVWFQQRHRGEHVPPGQLARGWYTFDDYAAQRETDLAGSIFEVGEGSPDSQNLDVATLFFLEDAARGGAGGYFSSNETPNPWLTGNREKMFVGYPVTGISQSLRGKMHATAPANDDYALLGNALYVSGDVTGPPGMSGAPVLVRHDDGSFYPAAVFLGGNQRSVVRAIDDRVVDLINRAERSANGGDNSQGSGSLFVSAGLFTGDDTADPPVEELRGSISEFGSVRVAIEGTHLAQWFVEDLAGERKTGALAPGDQPELPPGEYVIRFVDVGGYLAPPSQTVMVSAGQVSAPQAIYERGVPWKTDPNGDLDGDGVSNLIEYAFPTTGGGKSGYVPEAELVGENGAPQVMRVTYLRRITARDDGLAYEAEFSSRLSGNWRSAAPTGVEPIDGTWERVSVEEPVEAGTGSGYSRIKVQVVAE